MPRRRLWITCEEPLVGICEYCKMQFFSASIRQNVAFGNPDLGLAQVVEAA